MIDAHGCGKKSSKKTKEMEEQIKNIVTACIVANVPLIAKAVIEELGKQPQAPKTMTRKEAAKALSISLPTLDDLVAKGIIRAKKLGRKVIISQFEISDLLASGEPIKYIRGGRK